MCRQHNQDLVKTATDWLQCTHSQAYKRTKCAKYDEDDEPKKNKYILSHTRVALACELGGGIRRLNASLQDPSAKSVSFNGGPCIPIGQKDRKILSLAKQQQFPNTSDPRVLQNLSSSCGPSQCPNECNAEYAPRHAAWIFLSRPKEMMWHTLLNCLIYFDICSAQTRTHACILASRYAAAGYARDKCNAHKSTMLFILIFRVHLVETGADKNAINMIFFLFLSYSFRAYSSSSSQLSSSFWFFAGCEARDIRQLFANQQFKSYKLIWMPNSNRPPFQFSHDRISCFSWSGSFFPATFILNAARRSPSGRYAIYVPRRPTRTHWCQPSTAITTVYPLILVSVPQTAPFAPVPTV